MVVPEIWGNVPQRNKNFTGRSALLDQLRKRVTAKATAVLPHALHGLGGVGKTQLAIEYAYRYAHEYQLVWWIPADQNALVRSTLASLAPRLGITGLLPGRVEDAVNAVLDALRKGEPYERWLLIFDNADQPELVRSIMPIGKGHVIVTSRNHSWAQVVDALEVDVFTREESIAFLVRRVAGMTDADATRLAEEFGDLPLGLEQAASWLAETAMTVDTYLSLLKEEGSRVLAENPPPSDYPVPVAAAWSLSVARLRTQTPFAMDLLQCCAFFGAAPINLELLDRGRYVLDSPLRDTLRDPILMGRAIRALGRFALARIDNYRRTLEVHRIIQRLIRDEMDEQMRSKLRHDVHLLLAAADPGDPDAVENWPKYSDLLAHVGPSEVVACGTPEVRHLAQNIVRYLYITGNHSSGLNSADRALTQWTADSGTEEPFVLIMSRLKVQLLQALARYDEAYDLTNVTLEKMRDVLGDDHEEALILRNCHCISLRARGEFTDSFEFTEDSLRRHLAVFGDDHPRTLAAMNNHAEDLELNGSYDAARKLHEQIYEEKLVIYGRDDHPRVLLTLSALGRTAALQGHYAQAREIAERAHEGYRGLVREHVLSEGHPWVLQHAVSLSMTQRSAGDLKEALKLAAEAREHYRRAFYDDAHPGTLAASSNLGNAWRFAGDFRRASDLLQETFALYRSVFGPDHPYSLACAVNLSISRRRLGDVASARNSLQVAAEGLTRQLGSGHQYTLACMVNLATALAELGEIEQASKLDEEALPRLEALLGPDHPDTLSCAVNLALALSDIGQEERAAALLAGSAERLRTTLGHDHPDTLAAVNRKWIDLSIEFSATF